MLSSLIVISRLSIPNYIHDGWVEYRGWIDDGWIFDGSKIGNGWMYGRQWKNGWMEGKEDGWMMDNGGRLDD